MMFAAWVALIWLSRSANAEYCVGDFTPPQPPPSVVTQYNGARLPNVCINTPGAHHVFVIGDWGGIIRVQGEPPVTADKRSSIFPLFRRKFVFTIDDSAQMRVADEMMKRAFLVRPAYILNIGDNFYWGGVTGHCGGPPLEYPMSPQWEHVFEEVYSGPLLGLKWLGVLGNHDYGGYMMMSAWEKNVGYTWSKDTNRWITPALYWSQKVIYTNGGFSVFYLFVDTNPTEAWIPTQNVDHNICGILHNPPTETCYPQGPASVDTCHQWFQDLWFKQWEWLQSTLEVANKEATFQVVVTHFPAHWYRAQWNCLSERYGIDIHISGHIHRQSMYEGNNPQNYIQGGTCSLVSGGGGGITSEGIPSMSGLDDQYGFVDLELTPQHIRVFAISHSGVLRKDFICPPRAPMGGPACSPFGHRRLSEQNNATFI
jgi:hypothetical protein